MLLSQEEAPPHHHAFLWSRPHASSSLCKTRKTPGTVIFVVVLSTAASALQCR